MQRLLIIGAGGFGREVLVWAEHANSAKPQWEIAGFIDDNAAALDHLAIDTPIVGSLDSYVAQPNDVFLIAIGNSMTRIEIARKLEQKGWKFATLIHPTSIVGPRVEIGEGSVICPYCVLTCDIKVGRHTILNLHTTVGHDAKIGDFCTLSDHCDVTGYVEIGEGVLFGTHATITPGKKVGRYSVVGAGSAVIRNVQQLSTVVGVPAIKIMGHEDVSDPTWQPNVESTGAPG